MEWVELTFLEWLCRRRRILRLMYSSFLIVASAILCLEQLRQREQAPIRCASSINKSYSWIPVGCYCLLAKHKSPRGYLALASILRTRAHPCILRNVCKSSYLSDCIEKQWTKCVKHKYARVGLPRQKLLFLFYFWHPYVFFFQKVLSCHSIEWRLILLPDTRKVFIFRGSSLGNSSLINRCGAILPIYSWKGTVLYH